MKNKKVGRKPIEVIDSLPYSHIVFLVANGDNYAQVISEKRGTAPSPTVKQLKFLEKEKYLKSSKEKLLNKTIYEVNWQKIIDDFLSYINQNVDYVCSENDRLGLNLKNAIKGFDERISQSRDKSFQNNLKKNKYLQLFLKNYYSEIGRLKESWTITATFDFLSFFGNLNFIYQWEDSHEFYNIEKVFYILNQSESLFPEWLLNEKKPKTEEEEFERYKKIRKHTGTKFQEIESNRKKQLDDILKKNKELTELFILDRILRVVKIKPSLQLGLNKAISETGKEIFRKTLDKEKIKSYFDLRTEYNLFSLDRDVIEQDMKEMFGEDTK